MIGQKLLADGMLGSLARKLRVFGFDTEYLSQIEDSDLMSCARSQRRVIITADRSLAAKSEKSGSRCILVRGSTDSQRLREVVTEADRLGISLHPGPSRCALCNGRLTLSPRRELQLVLPEGVIEHHILFFVCGSCGQVYWRGTHWKKLRRLRRQLWPKKGWRNNRGRLNVSNN